MKYLFKLLSPVIWLLSLPRTIRVLKQQVENLSKQLEHYETSTGKDFENLAQKIGLAERKASNNGYNIKKHEKTLQSINVSADVCVESPSWVVLSYKGNKGAIVKFYDLDKRNVKEVQHFLNRFPVVNKHIDAPRFFTDNPYNQTH
jgi:hypothetical protein